MNLALLPSELQARIVRLQSCEKTLFEIDVEVVNMCNTVKNLLKGSGKRSFRNVLGGSFTIEDGSVILKKEGRLLASTVKNTQTEITILFHEVKTSTMSLVLEFCRYHSADVPQKDRKVWNSKFVEVEQSVLCDLASASYYLDIEPLVNLTSRAIATQVSGKSTNEIRETFCISCEMHSSHFATRYRLQQRIRNKTGNTRENTASTCVHVKDDRSVEELLTFINNGDNNPIEDNQTRQKKKRQKKRDPAAISAQSPKNNELEKPEGDLDPFSEELFLEEERAIDPDLKAQVDREVEEWRMKLEEIHMQYQGLPKLKIGAEVVSSFG